MFAVAAIRLMPSLNRIVQGLTVLRFNHSATEVIYDATRHPKKRPGPGRLAAERRRSWIVPFERSLVLEHLSYRYPSMPQPATDDVSLEIPRGH